MEFDKEKGNHMSILPVETGSRSAINDLGYGAPPRPSREQRRPSTMDKGRNASVSLSKCRLNWANEGLL
jgi:hypothetical protein